MSDTIAALSTPSGESAIALVRLSGGSCEKIALAAFGIKSVRPRTAHFGKYFATDGSEIDETVFTLFKAPASYTGEDMLEISCHGNPFIVDKILRDLFERGARPALPGEFTRRAFMNDKMDLSQAEAVSLIIGARSDRSLEAAQKQLSGELGRRISQISEKLADISALVEAYIDFPEDDLPPSDKSRIADAADYAVAEMDRLIETAKYSPLVHQGINAVIAGAPNAGKSSLLNRLVGDERAIVSSTAGTTRDFISEKISFGPHAANITDTAGLRKPVGEIEALGIAKAVAMLKKCDIRLLVLDTAAEMPELNEEVAALMTPKNTVVVLNKCDLPQSKADDFAEKYAQFECVKVSCENSSGISELRKAVERLIDKHHIVASADDILVGARHAAALERARNSTIEAKQKIEGDLPAELAASDLRYALDALGEIVGKTDNEAILDRIFSKFCIGK